MSRWRIMLSLAPHTRICLLPVPGILGAPSAYVRCSAPGNPWQYGTHAAVRIPRTVAPTVAAHKWTRPPWLQGGVRTGRGGRALSSLRVAPSQPLEPLLVDVAFASIADSPRQWAFLSHPRFTAVVGGFDACCVPSDRDESRGPCLSLVLVFTRVGPITSLVDWTGPIRRKGLVLPRTFESQWDASHRFPSVPLRKGPLGYPLASRSVPKLALTLQRVKSLISSLRRLVGFLTVDGQPNKEEKVGVKKKAV